MPSFNRVIVVGNLGRDPEVKYLTSGSAVCEFSIACSEKWKDKSETPQERTEWVTIVAWGKLAETCGQYLKKGRPVLIEGSLRTESWEKDGVKHSRTKVQASSLKFLGDGSGKKEITEVMAMESPAMKTPLSNPTRRAALASIDGLVVLLEEWNHRYERPLT